MPAINYVGSTISSQRHCAIRQVAQMSEMLGTKTSFCDLIISHFVLRSIELKPGVPSYDILHLPHDYVIQPLA
jgi:hypothetical protein